ncbi:CsbD family protein [Streptomyces durbertensis]|uniref:CsbD family protein n=1 Tax=Streptomyces durbertensis TaxID=2448886 RepID=A0ABR6ELV9_9ACTN|nr:CsbD family protein [Streptomyces durbertensis]MBB1246103.1 CsbD family protein [Streptomyces durbertensis]
MADEGAMDKMKGKAKQAAGKLTGDERKRSEGKTDETKGKAKGAMEDGKDRIEGLKDSLSEKRRGKK